MKNIKILLTKNNMRDSCFLSTKKFIEKVFRFLSYKKELFSKKYKKDIYIIDKKEKNCVYYKKNSIGIIFRDNCYLKENYEFCLKLNFLGYRVDYYYINNVSSFKKIGILPLSIYKNISYNEVNDLCSKYNLIFTDLKDILGKNVVNVTIKKCIKYKKEINNAFSNNFIIKYSNKISIVVLNYNNKGIIEKCIDNLLKYNLYNYEIIVVDNGSTDGSYEILKNKYKNQIILLKNIKNGCSSGRNLGVNLASGDYIMFLDSDQFVQSSTWLNNYLEIMESNKDFGAIGWAGGWFNKLGYAYRVFEDYPFNYVPPQIFYRCDIGYLGTGGMIIKKDIFNIVGGFDVHYDPTCYEDTDISLKIRNFGYEIYYCPYLDIIHDAHKTTKSGSKEHAKLINDKASYFINKWKKINPKLLKYTK